MKQMFDQLAHDMSALTTKRYSTSFSLGISFLNKELHKPIYAIYGFVRFADEIVDTFHGFPKQELLSDFRNQTYAAIEQGISLNPILHSFQWAVREYNITTDLIDTFLDSMQMDLEQQEFNQKKYEQYILGSAEVVGLMCLKVFVRGNQERYDALKDAAMKLGSAFQKINFLRDLRADYYELGRCYFPNIDLHDFNASAKKAIEIDIAKDFQAGFEGIKQLPKDARFGVYMAYIYYYKLFKKIRNTKPEIILNERIRIPNNKKYSLFVFSYLRHNLNLL